MFENKVAENGTYFSRYIMSWIRSGGDRQMSKYGQFGDWLRSLGHLSEDEIDDICLMAGNGKLELETSAKMFLKGA